MNEKMKKVFELLKIFLKHVTIYTIISLSCVASFFTGFYYKKMTTNRSEITIERTNIKKFEVNLAIDQYNNLIVIDNKSGNYTIYEDSIGKSIFQIYARTMVNPISNLPE